MKREATDDAAARETAASAPPPLTVLPGIGPARAERLARLGLHTVRDLLLCSPRRLTEEPAVVPTSVARESVGRRVRVAGHLGGLRFHRSGRRRSLLRARVEDEHGRIDLVFFNQPWQRERLGALVQASERVEAVGLVVDTASGPALGAPRVGTEEAPLPPPGALIPTYPAGDGVTQGMLRSALAAAIRDHADCAPEVLPDAERERLELIDLRSAVRDLHAPSTIAAFLAARRRVALEAMLGLQARLHERRANARTGRARAIEPRTDAPALFAPLLGARGFEPTGAQLRCLSEILADLARTVPMRRLLQGDVGAGKTAVACAAAAAVCAAGGQVALLAPTELLAEQHHAALSGALDAFGVRTCLLTGGMSAAARRAALARIESGEAGVAIGTHALFSGQVRFRRLDLAVIDEQQRFGVAQRRALLDKGADVHALTMTATPIPRTLALTVYGDLDVSLLDERPPGRGEVETLVLDPDERASVENALERRLERGERAFWVAPRIDDDDSGDDDEDEDEQGQQDDARGAEAAFARLSKRLGRFGVELVHGRIKPDDRAARVARFRSGESRLLVGTTVIEVGVDVPEATVLIVDGAERLGLAQLHQLRGRVGRGAAPSTCVLLARGHGRRRAEALAATDDGFAVAEEDLRLRGMGELAGMRQAGALGDVIRRARRTAGVDDEEGESAGDPMADVELLLFARDVVQASEPVRRHYLAVDGARDSA